MLFVESSEFSRRLGDYFGSDERFAIFQDDLARNPRKGDVMPGSAPLRKIRWIDPRRGKGKRGGLRVIYLHIPEVQVLYLLDVYGKDEADDLTKKEKALLKQLAVRLESEIKGNKHWRMAEQ